ncbi:MAG: hypothetical protein ACFFDS_04020 [Candidatus Thorarchaeota archaeon]
MKRKAIFGILLITIFFVQISSLMTTEAQIVLTDLKLEDEIQLPEIERFTDSMRTFIKKLKYSQEINSIYLTEWVIQLGAWASIWKKHHKNI